MTRRDRSGGNRNSGEAGFEGRDLLIGRPERPAASGKPDGDSDSSAPQSTTRTGDADDDLSRNVLRGLATRYRDVGDGTAGPERMAEARRAHWGALLVLDEASMVGTTKMRVLMRIVESAGVARLALIGARRQLRAVEAGQPFAFLQEAGMPTARMDGVLRQRDANLKAGVLHMVEANPWLAVEGLGNGVLEMDGDELGEAAAGLWLDLDPGLRAGTATLAPTHALRVQR